MGAEQSCGSASKGCRPPLLCATEEFGSPVYGTQFIGLTRYFEVLTTIALAIGLLVGKVLVPGAGMNVNPATLDTKAIASYTAPSAHLSTMDFIVSILKWGLGALAEPERRTYLGERPRHNLK